MIHALFFALASECATYIHDPQPPANLRDGPNGKILTTLSDGIEVSIDDDRGGWLHVTAPASGWVHVSVTTVRCPSNFRSSVRALAERAKSDRAAADTLVRFALVADGGPGESAYGGVYDLMAANPTLLLTVLDQFSDAQRRELLHTAIGLTSDRAEGVRQFDRAVTAHPSHPTSATWNAMPKSWKTGA